MPPGVNSYQEPVYALKRFGEVAVIYTANDYGDMWQIGINERGDYDTRRDEHNHYVAINSTLFENREAYFRGLDAKDVTNSYKFGTNIILHLLTRWEDKLRTVADGVVRQAGGVRRGSSGPERGDGSPHPSFRCWPI